MSVCSLTNTLSARIRQRAYSALVVLLLCATIGAAKADFAAGVDAAKRRLYDEAFTHLLPEAEAGNATAQLYVANMYRRGYGVTRNFTKAALWYRRAAEQDEASGMYNYAVHLRDGVGIPRNAEAATQWFGKAARAGHTAAMLNLGMRLTKGRGIDPDPVLGYAWVQKAALKGSVPAIRRRRTLESDLSTEEIRLGRKMARELEIR